MRMSNKLPFSTIPSMLLKNVEEKLSCLWIDVMAACMSGWLPVSDCPSCAYSSGHYFISVISFIIIYFIVCSTVI